MLVRSFLVDLLTCERFQHSFSERMKRCGKLLFFWKSHLPCAQSVENLRSTDVLISPCGIHFRIQCCNSFRRPFRWQVRREAPFSGGSLQCFLLRGLQGEQHSRLEGHQLTCLNSCVRKMVEGGKSWIDSFCTCKWLSRIERMPWFAYFIQVFLCAEIMKPSADTQPICTQLLCCIQPQVEHSSLPVA